MILRGLTVSLLFTALAVPAYGQVPSSVPSSQPNPDTEQTDEDEDAYRQSRRRRDAGNIFKDIDINTRSSGGGGLLGPNPKAIDRLNQGSRRHLNKLRAEAIAETPPGEIVKAEYEPSAEAKIDEYTATQEKQAWEEMIREANAGIGIIQGPKGGNGPQGSGQGQGQAQAGERQEGEANESGGSQSDQDKISQSVETNAPTIWRGGSTSSASAILDQIKGRSSGGSEPGQSPEQGQAQGQQASPQNQSGSQGEAANPSQNSSESQNPNESQNQSQAEASGQPQQEQNQSAEASAQGASESEAENQASEASDSASSASSSSESAQSAAEASAEAAAAKAARETESFSPLDRLKREALEQDDTGGRTSASDYLNRGK